MSELPTGWSLFSMRDLGGLSGGKTPSKANPSFWSSQDIPWVSPKDMKRNLLENTEDRISQSAVKDAGMTLYPSGSILMVTRSGILQHTFPVALAGNELTVNQDIKVLRPVEGIVPQFAFYLLKSFGDEILSACSKDGTTVQSIDSEKIEAFSLPLPPAAEQTRIAAKLDELLAQVDTLKARIDGIPALLKRFRQSILAAAVSGRLTEEWRDRPIDIYETEALGKLVAEPLRNGKSVKDGNGQRVLRLSALKPTGIDFFESKAGDWSDISVERYIVQQGDFLVSRGNGSKVLVGRGGLVCHPTESMAYPDTMIRIRPNTEQLVPQYLSLIWNSTVIRLQIESAARTTAGIWKISQSDLESLQLPLPSTTEQTEIVRRVEQLFAFADHLEARVKAAQTRIDRLTQSILAKAFRGELVPQDPNDEPASVLLERIKAQRAAEPKAKRGRGVAKLS